MDRKYKITLEVTEQFEEQLKQFFKEKGLIYNCITEKGMLLN